MPRLIPDDEAEYQALSLALLTAHLPHSGGVLVDDGDWWRCTAHGCTVRLMPSRRLTAPGPVEEEP